MDKQRRGTKNNFIFILISVLFILSFSLATLSNVSAAQPTYSIETICAVDNTVMKLSSATNAHAELYGQLNYAYKVCSSSPLPKTCTANNKIVSLSSTTNAHLAVPGSYATDICFGDSETYCGTDICNEVGAEEVISLTSTFNAHAGSGYSTVICCVQQAIPPEPVTPTAYFVDSNGNYINADSGVLPGKIYLRIVADQAYDVIIYETDGIGGKASIGSILALGFSGFSGEYTSEWFFDETAWIAGGNESTSELLFTFRDSTDTLITSTELEFTRVNPSFYWGDATGNPITTTIDVGTNVILWAKDLDPSITSLEATIQEYDSYPLEDTPIKTVTLTGSGGTLNTNWLPARYEVLLGSYSFGEGDVLEFYFNTSEGDSSTSELLYINKPVEPTTVYWANATDFSTALSGLTLGTTDEALVSLIILDYDGGDFLIEERDLLDNDGPWNQDSASLVDADNDGSIDDWVGNWTITQAIMNEASDWETAGEESGEDPQVFEFFFEMANLPSNELLVTRTDVVRPTVAYWANADDLSQISSLDFVSASQVIALIVLDYAGGENFIIQEEDNNEGGLYNYIDDGPWNEDLNTGFLVDADGDGDADDWRVFWTLNSTILDDSDSDDDFENPVDYEFYFNIAGVKSNPYLIVRRQLASCNDGICNQDEDCIADPTQPADCGGVCGECLGPPLYCSTEPVPTICEDYTSENACDSNECNLDLTAPTGGSNPHCTWNASRLEGEECYLKWDIADSTGYVPGTCAQETIDNTDNCDNGFLSYSWTAEFTWATLNSYLLEQDCLDNCWGSCLENPLGTWRCDPDLKYLTCQDGSETIACPAQIKLDFFDWQNLVVAIALILIIYIIINSKKKPVKKKRNSIVKKKTLTKKKRK